MPACIIEEHRDAIEAFCHRWDVIEFSVFGSVLSEDAFRADSDIDVLVSFAPDAHPTLFDLVGMEHELKALFGRNVDLITRPGIERSRNPIRREAILSSAEAVYVEESGVSH